MRLPIDLGPATALLVISGTGYNLRRRRDNDVRHRDQDPAVIARVAALVSTLGDEQCDWMEWAVASLEFLEHDTPLVEIGLLRGGEWARTPEHADRQLLDGGELSAWLASVGVHLDAS